MSETSGSIVMLTHNRLERTLLSLGELPAVEQSRGSGRK